MSGTKFCDTDGLAEIGFAAKGSCFPTKRRTTSHFVCAVVLILWSSSSVIAELPPSIEVVRAAYTQSISSIRTLDCRYRVSSSNPETEKHLASLGSVSKRLSWYEIQHFRDGVKVAVLFEGGSQPELITNRFWAMFDGKDYAHWTQSKKNRDGTFLPAGGISHNRPTFLDIPCLIHKFWGSEIYTGFQLKDLLARQVAHVVSRETIADVPCVVVDLGEHARNQTDTRLISTKVWLDPEKGFLLRQIVVKSLPDGATCFELSVQDIAATKNSLTDTLVYFPTKGSTRISTALFSVDVTSFQVNQPIPLRHFQAEFPQGARVEDSRLEGSPKIHVVGGIEARKELNRKIAKTPAANGPPVQIANGATGAPPATVRPIAESLWFKGLRISGFSILCLVSVFCAWRFWHRT